MPLPSNPASPARSGGWGQDESPRDPADFLPRQGRGFKESLWDTAILLAGKGVRPPSLVACLRQAVWCATAHVGFFPFLYVLRCHGRMGGSTPCPAMLGRSYAARD